MYLPNECICDEDDQQYTWVLNKLTGTCDNGFSVGYTICTIIHFWWITMILVFNKNGGHAWGNEGTSPHQELSVRKENRRKERKMRLMSPPMWIMVLLHFRVGLSLYKIPKRVLWGLVGPLEDYCLLSKVSTLNMHEQANQHLSPPRVSP
jgi:hypothetical protein